MLNQDIRLLDKYEQQQVDQSFRVQRQTRRIRGVIWSGLAALAAIVFFMIYGLNETWFGLLAAFVLVISVVEKVTYHAAMRRYEAIIRKLVRRIEELEGVPMTADEGEPVRSIRLEKHRAGGAPTLRPGEDPG